MNAYRILFRGLRWLSPALFAFAALADDANWPRFRGPNGGGIGAAANVPIQWTTNDYRWTVRLSGIGHSSPVVWGSRLFVTCGEPATGKRIVLCLNAASGRTLWQREYESQMFSQSGDNSYATATPTADADGVVVTWTTPDQVTLLALDNQGRDLWRRDLAPVYELAWPFLRKLLSFKRLLAHMTMP